MEETLKILVVADDKIDRIKLRLSLDETDMKIELNEVEDRNHGFCVLIKNHYDCVFLDHHSGNEDCLKFIQKIHSSGIKVPLVILVDAGNTAIAEKCINAGASEYFIKSTLSPETIAQILRRAIHIHQNQMAIDLLNQQLQATQKQLVVQNQELALQKQKIAILETSKLKSLFLATISHELITPMNAIIGFSQILLRPKFGQLTNQQLNMIEKILSNGKNLLMKINAILEFCHLEAGESQLKPELLDIQKLVSYSVQETSSLAQAKNLSLIVKTDLHDAIVFNDATKLRQILVNLITNAIKFTETGNIWVEITEISENQVKITVKDTGIGIASQDIKSIFTAFHQVDQGLSRKYSGTGLGLAIIDSLVRIMGGKIYIESQLGVGSMFTIELPRKVNFKGDLDHDPVVFSHHHHSLYAASPGNQTLC
ncbi:MAG: ATP-binding protein [Cuspidothrix sp.]